MSSHYFEFLLQSPLSSQKGRRHDLCRFIGSAVERVDGPSDPDPAPAGIIYAPRLRQAGVNATDHLVSGLMHVPKFAPRNEHELAKLDDEALLAYYGEACGSAHPSAESALGVLVFRHFPNVHRRCLAKIPRSDAEDVAMEAVVSAVRSTLDGRSVGEFHKWLHRIVGRRIADYTRKPRVDTTALPEEHGEDEGIWGSSGAVQAETGKVEIDELVERAMNDLSEAHREVVELFIFADQSAAETAADVNAKFPAQDPPMSIDNVSQIAKRFRDDLRRLLEQSDNST